MNIEELEKEYKEDLAFLSQEEYEDGIGGLISVLSVSATVKTIMINPIDKSDKREGDGEDEDMEVEGEFGEITYPPNYEITELDVLKQKINYIKSIRGGK